MSLTNKVFKVKRGFVGTSAEVYEYRKILDKVLSNLKNSDIREEDKADIQKFYRHLSAEGLSLGRIIKYIVEIQRLARLSTKPLASLTKDDVIDIVQKIESRQDYSTSTKHDYKLTLKKFFKCLKGSEEYPDEVSWIKIGSNNRDRILPEELLTEDEVKRMAEVAYTPRDKALILVLYESGCRIGEILSLKMKHVHFDEYGAVLMVNGKTGSRRVRIIASVPTLATWLNNHPLRDNPENALWISQGTRDRNLPLKYRTAAWIIRHVARRAGIRKRVYPHLFRHSRATELAKHLTEAQMKQMFGWVQGSDMASVYVHLSGRDVDDALLRLNGIPLEEKPREEKFRLIICQRCKSKNSPDSKFCNACGSALNLDAAIEIDETRAKADKLMTTLVKKPRVLDKLLETIEKMQA